MPLTHNISRPSTIAGCSLPPSMDCPAPYARPEQLPRESDWTNDFRPHFARGCRTHREYHPHHLGREYGCDYRWFQTRKQRFSDGHATAGERPNTLPGNHLCPPRAQSSKRTRSVESRDTAALHFRLPRGRSSPPARYTIQPRESRPERQGYDRVFPMGSVTAANGPDVSKFESERGI